MPENTLLNLVEFREGSFLVLFHMVRERDNLPPMRMLIHIFLMRLNRQVNSAVKFVLKKSDLGLKNSIREGSPMKG